MKKAVVFSLVLLLGYQVKSQTTEENTTRDSFESLWKSNGNSVLVFNNAYDGIKGTPYLHKFWFRGGLTMRTGSQYTDLKLKYDLMEDNVLVKENTGKEIFPNFGSVESFYYTDSMGVNHEFYNLAIALTNPPEEISGFYELLYEGKSNLYVKREKYLKHIASKGAYSSNKSYDEFRDNPPLYYLISPDEEIIKFKHVKKSVLSALNDDGSLSNYVKKNKLNLKKDEDIIKLIAYYETRP